MESLGQRLKRLREQKGLTVKEVSEQLGIPITTYREWEYGRAIKGEPYLKLAQKLGVPLSELMLGKPASPAPIFEHLEKMEFHLHCLKKELSTFF